MTDYLRRDAAAEYLKRQYGSGTPGTLAKYAVTGGGPKFRLMGRWPVYTIADLDTWATSRMSKPGHSTAEVGSANRQRSSAA